MERSVYLAPWAVLPGPKVIHHPPAKQVPCFTHLSEGSYSELPLIHLFPEVKVTDMSVPRWYLGLPMAVAMLLAVGALLAGEEIARGAEFSLGELRVVCLNTEIQFSSELVGSLPERVEEIIASGSQVTFAYTIRLRSHRLLWFDRIDAEWTVSKTVVYDALNKQYRLVCDNGTESSTVLTANVEEMHTWVSTFEHRCPMPQELLDEGHEYYVAGRCEVALSKPKWLLFPFGRNPTTSWVLSPTLLECRGGVLQQTKPSRG